MLRKNTEKIFDIAVIGGGIVGSAIARELSKYDLKIALIEAKSDVGDGTSKANTAILHTGFDASPGTLESKLVARGYTLLSEYAKEVGIPVEHTGAILVAWDKEQRDALPVLKEKAEENGYTKCEIITAEKVYEQIPNLADGALAGLTVPGESIICTWTTNLALAQEAVSRGTEIFTNSNVKRIIKNSNTTTLETESGNINALWVINAAGLGSDKIDNFFGYKRFALNPRKGELIVYDKQARPLINKILLPVPSKLGKGVLISPTIYGNVMLGPTAEEKEDRNDTSTSESGFEFLISKGKNLMPKLFDEEITASYAGLRAASTYPDYLIELDAKQKYIVVGGIRSTGLTSGMAIGEYVDTLLQESEKIILKKKSTLPKSIKMPNIGEASTRPYQDKKAIAKNYKYGEIICFCERVTLGEIEDTFKTTIPPSNLEGLRRRTRAMNGRCQGFFCGAKVAELFENERKKCTNRTSTASSASDKCCKNKEVSGSKI